MAPSWQWWLKETHRGTPVVVKMENPNNWSMVELDEEEEDFIYPNSGVPVLKGGRNKNAKQLTWVILLKAHKAAGCLASLATAFFSLAAIVCRRLASGRTDSNPAFKSRLDACIKVFLCLSMLLLCFEIAAYFRRWHFRAPDLQLNRLYGLTNPSTVKDLFSLVYSSWVLVRVEYIAPPIQFLANACIVLFLIQSFWID